MSRLNPKPDRQSDEQNNVQRERDQKLVNLLMSRAIRLPRHGTGMGRKSAGNYRTWLSGRLSTVLLMAAIPITLWMYPSSGEDDFYS